jgi:hypothetical protein
MSVVRGLPPVLAIEIKGSRNSHWSTVRSLSYAFVIALKILSQVVHGQINPLRAFLTFQTAS